MEFWRGTGPNSLLRRIEWDGWRLPEAGDTVTYLVFDPSERLRDASRTGRPGKFPDIPCEVRVGWRRAGTQFGFTPSKIGTTASSSPLNLS